MDERRAGISSFTLKIVAIVGMTCNHVAHAFADQMPFEVTVVLYSLGGLTFPIMGFLITEGYVHTSNIKHYAARLAIFAVISQIPFTLLWGFTGNVLFTLLIGLGILYAYDHMRSRGLFVVVLIAGLAVSLLCDWAFIGPVMIFVFYLLRSQGWRGIVTTMLIPFIVIGVVACFEYAGTTVGYSQNAAERTSQDIAIAATMPGFQDAASSAANTAGSANDTAATTESANTDSTAYAASATDRAVTTDAENTLVFTEPDFDEAARMQPSQFYLCQIGYGIFGIALATLLLCLYHGRRGRSAKWLFYVFYPAHLLIIWAVRVLLF